MFVVKNGAHLVDIMWNMYDFYWCGVKQESDYLHHGSGGVGLDVDSKFTKQDQMRSQKKQSLHISAMRLNKMV